MKNLKTTVVLACLVCLYFFINTQLFSQEYRIGGAAIYNFKSKGIGIDASAEFPLKSVKLLEGMSIVPQFSYFAPFNEISEFYIGSSIHLGFYRLNKWIFYGLVNASYNGWLNYDESSDADAKFSNLALEGGLGITRKKCVRPFFELRLNAIGIEPTVRLGLLYTFNCERRGAVPCSKIPPQPQF